MNIYYIGQNYPEKRCVIDKIPEYKYIPVAAAGSDGTWKSLIEKWQHAFAHRYSRYRGEKTLSCYRLMKRTGVVHTFNSCISGKNRWCATFETVLPRTNWTRSGLKGSGDKQTIRLFQSLAKENCLACLALSESTRMRQMDALQKVREYLSDEEYEQIVKKTVVLHPPQKCMVSKEEIVRKFENNGILEGIFVGHDFFRKGGKELIDCLLEMKDKTGWKDFFHLTVISSMEYDDYASHATEEEQKRYRQILEKEDWITYHESLPNEEVMDLCKKAHIGFLPTFADTYGYSVLEMQSCGCVMLTTDVRALPEISNENCGFICHLPQNELKEAFYQTQTQRSDMKDILKEEICRCIAEIMACSREDLLVKAINSWERIRKEHNPDRYADVLRRIFHS